MSQRSATQLLQAKSLHPVLQAALGSLNVQLDEELARYRRQRRGYVGVAHRSSARPQTSKQLDLIAVSAVGGRTQPQAASPRASSVAVEQRQQPRPTPRQAVPPTPAPVVLPATPTASSELALADHWTDPAEPMVPVAGSRSALTAPHSSDYDPYDYLESSSDLLRSLSEQEGEVVVKRGFWGGLWTPLGVGSVMLLLLSSALLGYVLMNPSSVANLRLKSPVSPSPDQSPPSPGATSSAPGVLPNGPNLANKEFVDLNLDTLTTIKPDSKSGLTGPARLPGAGAKLPAIPVTPVPTTPSATTTPTAKPTTAAPRTESSRSSSRSVPTVAPLPPAPVAASMPTIPVERAPAPRPNRPAPAAPRAAAPAPAAVPRTPARPKPQPAPVAASPAPSNYYYVVTPYSGDRALEQARQSVPDAYVVNLKDGAYIRMGTMSSEGRAQEMVQKLQQQGIPAQVHQP